MRGESLIARPPKLSVGDALKKFYDYSMVKWQKYGMQVESAFYNPGSYNPASAGLLSPVVAKQQQQQPILLLSTAKNIPRSALDQSALRENLSVEAAEEAVVLTKYPPFIEQMDSSQALPHIPFLVYVDDDLSDDQYAAWLATQVAGDGQLKHLLGRPPHLQPIVPESIKPSEDDAKMVMWTNRMHQMIFRLLNYPADLETLLPTIVDTMRMGEAKYGDDFNRVAVQAVYQTCMFDSNFSLIGSRLCNVISNSVQRSENTHGFRSLLLMELQKDYMKKEMLVKSISPIERKRVQNLAYFMADLFNNLIIVNKNNDKSRTKLFFKFIPELLMTLMDVPSANNLRTICNVLRMGVGHIIELESHDTETLVPLLNKLREKSATNEDAFHLIEMRDYGWRDYLIVPVNCPVPHYDIGGCEQEPVFFNPQGVAYLAASLADPAVCRELFY